jgi:hypothetical protein
VAALGHKLETLAKKAPTCVAEGFTDGTYCAVCNEIVSAQEIIPALGHAEVIDKGYAATKTENGLSDGKHCDVCGEVLAEQKIIYAHGSLGLAYAVTSDTTCEITGIGTCTDTELVIPKYIDGYEVTGIGKGAFSECSDLVRITYNGSIAEWKAISKGTEWYPENVAYTIYCTDGTIAKDGTVTYN